MRPARSRRSARTVGRRPGPGKSVPDGNPFPRQGLYSPNKEATMLGTVLLIILILLLIGALPRWPYSSGWGYYPSGGIGLILLILIVLLLMGRI
jgi:hypothetical protein